MAVESRKIKVRSIEFGATPFRKLRNVRIEFADRLTLISGHNGIGKSTVLGLVANTFGLTTKGDPKSYASEPFSANIERIVYLALDEVDKAQEAPASAPVVTAEVGELRVRKRCAMTKRSQWHRARVVPRTIDMVDGDPVGPDAKVPLPTIYLGIWRLAPTGEAGETDVLSRLMEMEEEDKEVFLGFIRSVIPASNLTPNVTYHSISHSHKRTAQPGYVDHE